MQKDNSIILQAKGITKYFGGVCALNNVDLELIEGEVLGLVGDNGAGNSTLIKMDEYSSIGPSSKFSWHLNLTISETRHFETVSADGYLV